MNAIECLLDISVFLGKPSPISQSDAEITDVTLGRYFRFGRSNRILGDPRAVSRSGERTRRKFSSTGERAPGYRLSPNSSKNSRGCRLLIGHRNALYYCAQSANSFSWALFVSSYTTAIVLSHLHGSFTKLVRAKETFIFYFPNQKRRNYRWVEKSASHFFVHFFAVNCTTTRENA